LFGIKEDASIRWQVRTPLVWLNVMWCEDRTGLGRGVDGCSLQRRCRLQLVLPSILWLPLDDVLQPMPGDSHAHAQ
jgi:hypothetical protein